MRFHPRKRDLLRHAESVTDGGMPISMEAQRHITKCPKCRAEVDAMQNTLRFVAQTPELEPSEALTAQILNAARGEQHAFEKRRRSIKAAARLVQGLACATGVVVVAAISFQAAIAGEEPEAANMRSTQSGHATQRIVPEAEHSSPEAIRRVSSEYQELAAVLDSPANERQSLEEWKHRREALALNSDLAEALAALQRNPGCIRANQLATASLQRQVDALKSLYVERTL